MNHMVKNGIDEGDGFGRFKLLFYVSFGALNLI